MDIFVARQPIFDKDLNIYAYELLFRSGVEGVIDFPEEDQATSCVITRSFIDFGIDNLVESGLVFINFTKNLLIKEVASLFPKDKLTVEVLENVEPTAEVVSAVANLKKQGYKIALDDFEFKDLENPLIQYADIIKVDFLLTSEDEQERIVKLLGNGKIKFLAEKVETKEVYEKALKWGYSFFQGYFFAKPEIKRGKNLESNKLTQLQLLKEVNRLDLDMGSIESIVKQDVATTVKLLKYMNSSAFGFRRSIDSIKHALNLLGIIEVRKWLSIIALNSINDDKPKELSRLALKRAKFLELLSRNFTDDKQSEMFILGMFSLLDTMLETDMEKLITEFPFSNSLKDALTGDKDSFYGKLLSLVRFFEEGNWDKLISVAEELKLNKNDISKKHIESETWSELIVMLDR